MHYRTIIVGGGFYGCFLATALAPYISPIALLEREKSLLLRASRVNQARLHNGYHYPRSFQTAASSRQNLDSFRQLFETSVNSTFESVYCVTRHGSKVNRRHFERFCDKLGIPLRAAPARVRSLFNPDLVDGIYLAEEYAFDVDQLRLSLTERLNRTGVDIRTSTESVEIFPIDGRTSGVRLASGEVLTSDWVLNCTYSRLTRLAGLSPIGHPRVKHQVAEVALVEVPEELKSSSITIMDGPFFSTMPFPSRNLHSLTHVRYTPHFSWSESEVPHLDPYEVLERHSRVSHFPWMVRDARRYLPIANEMRHVESLFEIKTLLCATDVDDSRPIAFHRDPNLPGVISILGGKIDNVFDVLGYVRAVLDL